jgi:2-haloacid dehalogenase
MGMPGTSRHDRAGEPVSETVGSVRHRRADAPSLLIFDVNETLIDIDSLTTHFEHVFGDGDVMRQWFGELVMYSMCLTLAGYYADFFTLGRSVLEMVARIRGVDLSDAGRRRLTEAMQTMPAHPDAAAGLERLRADSYRLVTLTNSPHRPDTPSPLENAGLAEYFEQQFTVDGAGVFKPATHLYRRVAADMDTPVHESMMVAAHAWDLIGAQGAGMQGALITRPGNHALHVPGVPAPTVMAADITELASQLCPTDDERRNR